MNPITQALPRAILPTRDEVLRHQGMPTDAPVPAHIHTLFEAAAVVFEKTARPIWIMSRLSREEFDPIFRGEGFNAPDALLGTIYPQASNLALFALTFGQGVTDKIEELFENRDFALGSMLDAVASRSADRTVTACECSFFKHLKTLDARSPEHIVVSYSPGYCGWHISAQRALFDHLDPARIGIQLKNSYLMTPLKSVSGLLVAGRAEIHISGGEYAYCGPCEHRSCLTRVSHPGAMKAGEKSGSTRRQTEPSSRDTQLAL